MPTDSRRAKLIICFATVYLVWGSTYLAARIGVTSLPPILFGGFRFILAGILLGLVALALGRKFDLDRSEWRHLAIIAAGTVLIPNGLTNWAMQSVASNQAAILNASAALWIALFATRGRRAHAIDRRTLVGLGVGFVGTALIVWPESGTVAGDIHMQLLILVAVFVWSAATVRIRNVHSNLDLLCFSSIQMLLGGLMMTSVGFAMGEWRDWTWSGPGLMAMVYLTIFSSCIAYTAFSWLTRNTTPAMVGTYSYVNPAIAAVLGWWLLDEHLDATSVWGMAIMCAGVALVNWPQREVMRLGEDQRKEPSSQG